MDHTVSTGIRAVWSLEMVLIPHPVAWYASYASYASCHHVTMSPCPSNSSNSSNHWDIESHQSHQSHQSLWPTAPLGILRRGQRYANSENMPKLEAQWLCRQMDRKHLWKCGGVRLCMILSIFNLEKKNLRHTWYTGWTDACSSDSFLPRPRCLNPRASCNLLYCLPAGKCRHM